MLLLEAALHHTQHAHGHTCRADGDDMGMTESDGDNDGMIGTMGLMGTMMTMIVMGDAASRESVDS